MADETKAPESTPRRPPESEDDRRAAAATLNRKRALEDWDEKKRLWREMGVPAPLPAAGSSKSKK